MNYWSAYNKTTCSRCGASYDGDQSGRDCWYYDTKTYTYTYYNLGCGKSDNTVLGTVFVEKSTSNWVTNLTLTAGYENTGNMVVREKPYIWNGAEASESNVYEVGASGSYTLQLNAGENANTQAAIITIDVCNVDVTPPMIKAHTQEPLSDWSKEGVMVCITEVVDLQPDGSVGSGLHNSPYSYDNGNTWTAEASHLYLENGTHCILVRDWLENISSYEVSFQNVDATPPTVESIEYDQTKNIPFTEIVVTAMDLQPDGSAGCGLHETPYSFDGGQTWTENKVYRVDKNGVYPIMVRDALDNRITVEETIQNIDCTGPRIRYTMVSDSWTNQDVVLYLAASDVNEDGTKGSGLADAWYSVDDGHSWSKQNKLVFKENTSFNIIARDVNDNYTTTRIHIKQIDKEQPWASLTMEILGAGMDMQVKLTAYGEDDYSGIAENGFSWNGGSTYSDESSKIVTENGLYQVYVKDKAGNSNNAVIEVDVFPAFFPELPLIPEETQTWTEEAETETEEFTTEEWNSEEVIVTMEERIERPQEIPTMVLKQDFIWEKIFFALLIMLAGGLLSLFLVLFWSRTIGVYVEKANGKQQYLGRLWIFHKEERYFVNIPDSFVKKAMTMCFSFRPSLLFLDSHKNEEVHFLFPDGVCITLTIERNMEME